MGNLQGVRVPPSNDLNDYNPFDIPSIKLNSPCEFSPAVAFRGCPPSHRYTRAEFSRLSTPDKAAYADGVVRGSYKEDWMMEQMLEDIPDAANSSAIGALAYIYLKTSNENALQALTDWNERNKNNTSTF